MHIDRRYYQERDGTTHCSEYLELEPGEHVKVLKIYEPWFLCFRRWAIEEVYQSNERELPISGWRTSFKASVELRRGRWLWRSFRVKSVLVEVL